LKESEIPFIPLSETVTEGKIKRCASYLSCPI